MEKVKSRPGLLKYFNNCPTEIREYFEHLPPLIDGLPLMIALAYVFSKLELAHNMALYCGITKLHRADSGLARRAVQGHHMSRKDFRDKYEVIYGKAVPESTSLLLVQAEAVRDRVLHGKKANNDQMRNAIAHVLAYANGLNDLTQAQGGPKPFGDLRGFKGPSQSLEKSTTRWMLKGMGFDM